MLHIYSWKVSYQREPGYSTVDGLLRRDGSTKVTFAQGIVSVSVEGSRCDLTLSGGRKVVIECAQDLNVSVITPHAVRVTTQ